MNTQWGKLFGYFLVSVILGVVAIGIPMAFGGSWLPDSIADESTGIDALFWGLTGLSIVIMAVVAAIVIYSLVHWRVKPGDEGDGAPIHGNHRLEVFWTVIPTIIVTVVAIFAYIVLVEEESAPANPSSNGMVVDVRGFQYGWGFSYPDLDYPKEAGQMRDFQKEVGTYEVLDATNLVLPEGKTTLFRILSCSGRETQGYCEERYGEPTANPVESDEVHRDDDEGDVLHAFWVPEARLKADSIPNIPNYTQWTPNDLTMPEDTFQVVCAELCGEGHNAMRSDVCVVPQATFDWWLDNSDTTCQQLRMLNCSEDAADNADDLLATVDKLLNEDPEADCDDVKEQA